MMKLLSMFHMNLGLTTVTLIVLLSSSVLLTACSNPNNSVEETHLEHTVNETSNTALLVYGEVKVDKIKEMQLDFPARIEDVFVKEGTIVAKGAPLLSLNFDDYSLQIATLEKELEGYELELSGLESSTNATAANLSALSKELALKKSYISSGEDPDILPLQNSLMTLNSDLKEAQKLYETNLALLEVGAISETEVNNNKLACDKLQQQISDINTSISKAKDARQLEVSALQSKLNATSLEVGNIDTTKASQINQLQVKIKSLSLTLQNMKSKLTASYLQDHNLIAEEGNLLIYDISVVSGTSVNGLGQPLFSMMDLNTLYVMVDIPEESLSQVQVGNPVTLKIADQDQSNPITGVISRISEYALEKEGDTVVEATITVTAGKTVLKPGLSIDAYINSL